MADDNNQELSMEDILSSIKNILTEEGQGEQTAATEAESESPFAAPVEEPTPEDIIDLSPSMRIEEEGEAINLDDELDGISGGIDDFSLTSVAASDGPFNPENDVLSGLSFDHEKDLESDPFYEEPEVPSAMNDFDENMETENSLAEAEMNFPDIDDTPAAEMSAHDEKPFLQGADDEIGASAIPQVEAESIAVEAEPLLQPQLEPEFVAEFESVSDSEPEPELVEELPPVITAAGSEPSPKDAVDVSASIISNFAKMFAKEEAPQPEPAYPEPQVLEMAPKMLGNGSKTIEDVVADVIRNLIAEDVSAEWKQHKDYDAFARETIISLTREWLEANLPAVVEKTVKAEIERVMAKVGN